MRAISGLWYDELLTDLIALKCDLRDDRATQERLARYGMHTVQYEEGLAVARRIRASRYLGTFCSIVPPPKLTRCVSRGRVQLETQSWRHRSFLRGCTRFPQYPGQRIWGIWWWRWRVRYYMIHRFVFLSLLCSTYGHPLVVAFPCYPSYMLYLYHTDPVYCGIFMAFNLKVSSC